MKKTFFQERTTAEVRKLQPKPVYQARNLVNRILGLSNEDALELRFPIIPGEFRANALDSAEASRKCYKHGEYLRLAQPRTQGEALEAREIPLQARARSLDKLRVMREEEINFLGYSFKPVQGNDRKLRRVPFAWILEAARLYAYAETNCSGIEVKPYVDSRKAEIEGGEIVCRVPSRTKRKARYTLRLNHVPVIVNNFGNAIAYSLSSDFEASPEHRTFNIRYNWEDEAESSQVFTFYPQDIAAYYAVIKKFTGEHRLAPITFSPLAFPSRLEAEFYNKLGNNIVIYEPSLSGKDKQRKLHMAEKSILIARSISVLGHDATMFWSAERDGRIQDYNWGN